MKKYFEEKILKPTNDLCYDAGINEVEYYAEQLAQPKLDYFGKNDWLVSCLAKDVKVILKKLIQFSEVEDKL